MKLVIFGLTITSSWGNGHATIWRGLCRSLIKRGYQITFFEKDVSYYADQRDLQEMEGMEICLYNEWQEVYNYAKKRVLESDAAMVTSYAPDGIAATELIWKYSAGLKLFYDLDTPVTLKNIELGKQLSYIHPDGLYDFDLVFSYTGGKSLDALESILKAKKTAPLYGSADPYFHYPVEPDETYKSDLSYLGTYSEDRQDALEKLFIKTAQSAKHKKFLLCGSSYPYEIKWDSNVYMINHIAPPEHPAFYSSSLFTLNITRSTMAEYGYCPSGRLFEAAACGTPIISDYWEGLETFFLPGEEIIIANTTDDVLNSINMSIEQRSLISRAAKSKILGRHTSDHRAEEFEKELKKLSIKVVKEV